MYHIRKCFKENDSITLFTILYGNNTLHCKQWLLWLVDLCPSFIGSTVLKLKCSSLIKHIYLNKVTFLTKHFSELLLEPDCCPSSVFLWYSLAILQILSIELHLYLTQKHSFKDHGNCRAEETARNSVSEGLTTQLKCNYEGRMIDMGHGTQTGHSLIGKKP